MKIAILGGTGPLGQGLALRWAELHEIAIGSRSEAKAKAIAERYRRIATKHYGRGMRGSIDGDENRKAAKASEVVVLTIPYKDAPEFVRSLRDAVMDKDAIVSPIVPIKKAHDHFEYTPYPSFEGPSASVRYLSAAELVAKELRSSRVVSAFHTLPAQRLASLSTTLDYDVLMAGDDKKAVGIVAELVKQIPQLRPLHVGPLATSRMLEALTPLLLNLGLYNRIPSPSIRIV